MKNKTIIIAEAGINHNGKLQQAKKLIDTKPKMTKDFFIIYFLVCLTKVILNSSVLINYCLKFS